MRLRGLKIYRSKGRLYAYHRATGKRLRCHPGSPEFLVEIAEIERETRSKPAPRAGTLGRPFSDYQASAGFQGLAPSTRHGYRRMINLIAPLAEMPLVELTPVFVAELRDRLALKHGFKQANYVLAVTSTACEFGKERGLITINPVMGIRRVRRPRDLPRANRPWSAEERKVVLATLPAHLKVPVALAAFTGMRKSDVLKAAKSAIQDGRLFHRTGKTGKQIALPLHDELRTILAQMPSHSAVTIAATSNGTPWTVSGFNSSFIKAIARLESAGLVGPGLTFHGLRHTVGTVLVEAGCDLNLVRSFLGQKTLSMAMHYSANADMSARMDGVLDAFNLDQTEKRTKLSNRGE